MMEIPPTDRKTLFRKLAYQVFPAINTTLAVVGIMYIYTTLSRSPGISLWLLIPCFLSVFAVYLGVVIERYMDQKKLSPWEFVEQYGLTREQSQDLLMHNRGHHLRLSQYRRNQ